MKDKHDKQLFKSRKLCSAVLLTFAAVTGQGVRAEAITRHHDGVLGTSLDVSVHGADTADFDAAVDRALEEIARLENIFTTYREDSELMTLNREHATSHASSELREVIRLCEDWLQRSQGNFSCRLGALQMQWLAAEQVQEIPDRPTLRHQARDAAQGELVVEETSIRLNPAISLDPSGLAKGYIIDRALAVLRGALPMAVAIKFDIGGDAVYWGVPPGTAGWEVAIANPVHTADNGNFLGTLNLGDKAVAASGHFSRTRDIGRRRFSHILDPRDGWPIEGGSASVVLAADAATADAVATALAVQSLSEGIEWVEGLDGVEALVIDQEGHQLTSSGWPVLAQPDDAMAVAGEFSFELGFSLPERNVTTYARPYVAIWMSDAEQRPLKNLLLLGESERWARENTRWWRRVGRRNPALLDGVARPTRGPGQYQLQWDGRDDFGKPVSAGSYLLHIEVSREHGDSTYRSLPFTLGTASDQSPLVLEPEGEQGEIELILK